jgi:putative GTP pyrophosphokinase
VAKTTIPVKQYQWFSGLTVEVGLHTLLIFDERTDNVDVKTFSDFRLAIAEYFRLERERADNTDVVLVAADDSESVRFGFKNYFSDAREFVGFMDQICAE